MDTSGFDASRIGFEAIAAESFGPKRRPSPPEDYLARDHCRELVDRRELDWRGAEGRRPAGLPDGRRG